MYKLISKVNTNLFSTLVLAEHNGKALSKNSIKLLSAAHKFGEDVQSISYRFIYWSLVMAQKKFHKIFKQLYLLRMPVKFSLCQLTIRKSFSYLVQQMLLGI